MDKSTNFYCWTRSLLERKYLIQIIALTHRCAYISFLTVKSEYKHKATIEYWKRCKPKVKSWIEAWTVFSEPFVNTFQLFTSTFLQRWVHCQKLLDGCDLGWWSCFAMPSFILKHRMCFLPEQSVICFSCSYIPGSQIAETNKPAKLPWQWEGMVFIE